MKGESIYRETLIAMDLDRKKKKIRLLVTTYYLLGYYYLVALSVDLLEVDPLDLLRARLDFCAAAKNKKLLHLPRHAQHIFVYHRFHLPSKHMVKKSIFDKVTVIII